jgi:geranylgeranyl transferase type-2 subunit beta
LGRLDLIDREEILAWVMSCQRSNGGFGGSERHDAHLLYTLSALQILALYDELGRVDADAVARCGCCHRLPRLVLLEPSL